MSSSTGGIIVVLSVIGSIFCLVCFVVIAMNRKAPIMKMSQYVFLELSTVGSALLCLSNVLNLGKNTDSLCMWRVYGFVIFFTLMIVPLVSKTHRIHRIMSNKRLKKMVVSNAMVYKEISFFVICMAGMCFAWELYGKYCIYEEERS